MSKHKKETKALKALRAVMEELSTPQAGAEILAYLAEVTAPAAREHDQVLARSQELGGILLFPGS